MYHKIVQENTPTYLKEHLPPLVPSTNPYHRRRPLQRQVPKHKTETYRQSLSPSTTTLWNNLTGRKHTANKISRWQVKHFLSRNDTNPPPFFYNGRQKAQTTHCKLRLGIIKRPKLRPINRHLTTNSSCDCGERKETSEHYVRFYTAHVLHTYVKTPYSNSLQIC